MIVGSGAVAIVRTTPGDAAALIATVVATVFVDLVTAVIIGVVVASSYALRTLADTARLDEVPLDEDADYKEERALLEEHVVAYRLEGPLFFAAAQAFLVELVEIAEVRVVILRMSRLQALDATGAAVLADAIRRLEGRGITVLLSGIKQRHAKTLRQLGVYASLAHERHVFPSTPSAIEHAHVHVRRTTHGPAVAPTDSASG